MQGFDPVGWRKGSLEQKGAHNVVIGTDDALSFIVLGGGVGA